LRQAELTRLVTRVATRTAPLLSSLEAFDRHCEPKAKQSSRRGHLDCFAFGSQ
jgi:hypothetical protein